MKKIGLVLAIFVLLTAQIFAGGGSQKAAATEGGEPPFTVDLSTVKVANWSYSTKAVGTPVAGVRNVEAFAGRYDGVVIVFPEFPVDVTKYKRMTVNGKYFNADGEERAQGDDNAMVVVFYDITGDLEGPNAGSGPNTPFKEFNLGGYSSTISKEKGARVILGKQPGGLLLQNTNAAVKFIEITEVTFHD